MVTLSFVFKGEPIVPSMVLIKSDRSIATHKDPADESHKIDWAFVMFVTMAATFFIGLFSAITIPAYQDYKKRAKEAQEKAIRSL